MSNVQGIFRLVELTVCDTVYLVLTDDPTTTQFQGQDITEYDQYLPMHPIFGNIHSNDEEYLYEYMNVDLDLEDKLSKTPLVSIEFENNGNNDYTHLSSLLFIFFIL